MTDWLIRLRPDPGYGIDPAIATPTDEGDGAVTRILESVEGALGQVPALVWIGLLLISGAATVITLPVARHHARLAGARAAGHADAEPGDRALFFAAMIPAALFLGAVLAGSFRGLAAFGRDELRWTDGWEYLVPGTLDGVALSFGFLAFRAVKRSQSPDRANRLVWAAALASAVINFAHEAGLPAGSWLGGAYLGLMSVFGMLIFHEFLAQFEEGAEAVHRKTPKFGLRWITWPTNTMAAWLAWHNHPAPEGSQATIAAAVNHLEQVRAAKRAKIAATDHPAPWWTPILPWVRVRQLEAIGEAERSAGDQQRADMSAAVDAAKAEAEHLEQLHRAEIETLRRELANIAEQNLTTFTERLTAIEAERDTERSTRLRVEQQAERTRSDAAQRLEQVRSELAEQILKLRAEHAEQLAQVRAEAAESAGRGDRSNVTPLRRSNTTDRSNTPKMSDREALERMFTEHPEPDFVWTDREVNKLTGAGFSGRAPRLVTLATEHLKTCDAERHDGCFRTGRSAGRSDNPKERSA